MSDHNDIARFSGAGESNSAEAAIGRFWRYAVARPARVFLVLSLLFGTIAVFAGPPLQAPDELSHFMRIYGLSKGELLPKQRVNGKLGTAVPAELHAALDYYETVRRRPGLLKNRYADTRRRYRDRQANTPSGASAAPVFVPYQGSEGYSPTAYLPHVAAMALARLLQLDFLPMLYLVRLAGLVFATAVIAYAIALTPRLKWAFVLIAMLPASLYGRSMLSADGGILAYTLVVTALFFAAALNERVRRRWEHAGWLVLCALGKPTQVAFVLLGAIRQWTQDMPAYLRSVAVVMLPAALLAPLWVVLSSGEMSAWILVEEGLGRPEEFDPIWKLQFMWEHPLHFPRAVAAHLAVHAGHLWEHVIGVLGSLDTFLPGWAYPLLTVALLCIPFERVDMDRTARIHLVTICLTTVLGYTLLVYLALFMTWTPVSAELVWGVQGRYFIVVLAPLAIAIASLSRFALPSSALAAIAIGGSALGGVATIEALRPLGWL